jgi:peptide/nickel transport system permease protein
VKFVRRYLIPRLLQYLLVNILGITMIFILPRLMPNGPVERIVSQLQTQGANIDPKAAQEMVRTLKELYGLDQPLLTQYVTFWRRLFQLDFGPSLVSFPVPVTKLIGQSLPWTFGLLLTTSILIFVIGNISGGLAGYFRRNRLLKGIDWLFMFVAPMPYYIVALILMIFLAYIWPIFPVGGGYTIGAPIEFSLDFIKDVLLHAFLPALSLVLLGVAGTHQIMRLIVQGVNEEDYVRYANIGAVKESTVFSPIRDAQRHLAPDHPLRHGLCSAVQRRPDHGDHICLPRDWIFVLQSHRVRRLQYADGRHDPFDHRPHHEHPDHGSAQPVV